MYKNEAIFMMWTNQVIDVEITHAVTSFHSQYPNLVSNPVM